MKNSMHTILTVISFTVSLNITAQPRSRGNENQQPNQNPQNQTQQQRSSDARWGNGNHSAWGQWGGGVTIHIGNTPNYGYPNFYGNNYNGYYGNNYHSIKQAARQSLRNSAQVIGSALQFSDWNDIYSPWLAKAIRHQQYAKQLYFWGDYAAALNHAERAGFLAWNTLNYFNNGYGYNDGYSGNGYQQDPYQDPNNPYYRKGNTPSSNQNSTNQHSNNDDGFDERKLQGDQSITQDNSNMKPNENTDMKNTEADTKLPQSKLSDKELLKVNLKDLDIDQ